MYHIHIAVLLLLMHCKSVLVIGLLKTRYLQQRLIMLKANDTAIRILKDDFELREVLPIGGRR
jgi:hypothetical protein